MADYDRIRGMLAQNMGGPKTTASSSVSSIALYTTEMQAETLAYLARFSGSISDTYREALNQAIYSWKQAGVYILLQDLWLTCADTQTDSLRNLISAARDATKSGSPSFTTLKGFGGFGVSNYISLPFLTSGITITDSAFALGVKWDATGSYSELTSANAGKYGTVELNTIGGTVIRAGFYGTGFQATANVNSNGVNSLLGVVYRHGVNSESDTGPGPGSDPVSIADSPYLFDSVGCIRLRAFAVMPTATTTQVRKFLGILHTFLEDIGAFG